MKRLIITSVLMASLIGPAGALAVPADTHAVAQPAGASAVPAGTHTGGRYVGSTFVQDARSPDAAQPVTSTGVDLRSPDAAQPVTPAVVDLRSPDAQSPVTAIHVSTPVSASPSPSSFDWNDAAIGAGSMLALALLALGAVMLGGATRRHRTTA